MASGIAHRGWQIARSDFMTDEGVDEAAFRGAVQHELAMAEHIGERLGVAILAAPKRQRFGDLWITVGWRFQTASIPAVPNGESEAAEWLAEKPAPAESDVDLASAA